MSDEELSKVLKSIDEALAVFNKHEGRPLNAKEVSVKSMLMALRAQLMNEQRRFREPAK